MTDPQIREILFRDFRPFAKMLKLRLKFCPFCKGVPRVGSLGGDKQNWAIWCECGIPCVENEPDETLDDIKVKWNRRDAG